MRTTPVQITLGLALCLGVAACFSDLPSTSNAQAVFVNLQKAGIRGKWELASFEKTNAQEQTRNGVRSYIVQFRAQVRYPDGLNLQCENAGPINFGCNEHKWSGNIVQRGGTKENTGVIIFQKTEKGWLGMDGVVY